MRKHFNLLLVLIAAGTLTSCVSGRKYKELETAKQGADKRNTECQAEKRKLQDQINNLDGTAAARDREIADLKKDTSVIYPLYRRTKAANADLNLLYEKAIAQSNSIAKDATNKQMQLAEELERKQKELERREEEMRRAQKELDAAQGNIAASQRKLEDSQKSLEAAQKAFEDKSKFASGLEGDLGKAKQDLMAREQRVKELEDAIAAQKAKTDALRQKISSALSGFSANELSVTERDGKVYVSLSQELLFASGSAEVDKKGKDALSKLAVELNKVQDIDVVVEGHTDNVPFKGTGGVKDNWDLSVVRSTAIVRILTGAGVDAHRITAAGRGEYIPVSDNTTSAGKAKNRRTEIILSPKLEQLYDIIKN